MAKKVYVRLGISDVVLTREESDSIAEVQIVNQQGKVIATSDTYFVAYEDDEGVEIDEADLKD